MNSNYPVGADTNLTISPKQLEFLQRTRAEASIETMRRFLSLEFPAFLPRFPEDVQKELTRMMVQRARSAGATNQRSIAMWCLLMLNVAPNFGQDPAVRAWLSSTGASTDDRILQLPELLAESDWLRLDAQRSDLPLLTPVELDRQDLQTRTAAALPKLLWSLGTAFDYEKLATEGAGSAKQYGMADLPDAPFVMAVARSLYGGDTWLRPPRWLQDIQDREVDPRVRLEMLRFRIMLDHGRWA